MTDRSRTIEWVVKQGKHDKGVKREKGAGQKGVVEIEIL